MTVQGGEERDRREIRRTFEINNTSRSASERIPAGVPVQSLHQAVALSVAHERGLLGQLTEGDLQKGLGVESIFWRWGD